MPDKLRNHIYSPSKQTSVSFLRGKEYLPRQWVKFGLHQEAVKSDTAVVIVRTCETNEVFY